jgi:hypothetical protein
MDAQAAPVVHDTLPFCHLATPAHPNVGWTIGLLQFVPWFLSPLLFVRPPHAWTWRRECFNTILFLAAKALIALVIVLQVHLGWRVPDPRCTDIFGAVHGFPSAAATLVGFYLAVAAAYQAAWLRGGRGRGTAYQAWYALAAFALSAAALGGLYLNGLNTPVQIAGSALLGILYGALLMALVRGLLAPLFLARLQAHLSQHAGCDGAGRRAERAFEMRALGYIFGEHDSFLLLDDAGRAAKNAPARGVV